MYTIVTLSIDTIIVVSIIALLFYCIFNLFCTWKINYFANESVEPIDFNHSDDAVPVETNDSNNEFDGVVDPVETDDYDEFVDPVETDEFVDPVETDEFDDDYDEFVDTADSDDSNEVPDIVETTDFSEVMNTVETGKSNYSCKFAKTCNKSYSYKKLVEVMGDPEAAGKVNRESIDSEVSSEVDETDSEVEDETIEEALEETIEEALEETNEDDIEDVIDIEETNEEAIDRKFNWSLDHKFTIVKGHVQSGKTAAIIDLAKFCFSKNKDCLIIVRNVTHDLLQLHSRFKSATDIPIYTIKNHLELEKKSPKIILSLANSQQLNTFILHLRLNKNLVTIIDEADFLDTGKDNKTSESINTIKAISANVFLVSATVMDCVFMGQVYPAQVVHLKCPKEYKGINYFNWPELDDSITVIKPTHQINDIIRADKNIVKYLHKFSQLKPLYSEIFDCKHPVLHLIKFCRLIISMEKLQDYIKTKYPKKITSIVLNSNGIRIYSPQSLKQLFGPRIGGYYHLGKKLLISRVLTILKNFGGTSKFPRILIIAGDMSGRSMTFSSDDYKSNTMTWHLTGMYLTGVSKITSQPELIQSLRTCCVAKDELPIDIYCRPQVKEDIFKSVNLQDEYFTRATNNDESLDRQMVQIPMSKYKFAKGRSVTRNTKIQFNKVNGYDGYNNSRIAERAYEGKYSVTNSDNLGPKSKMYYSAIVKYMKKHGMCNHWYGKAGLIHKICSQGYIEQQSVAVNNTTYSWHTVGNKDCENKKINFDVVEDYTDIYSRLIWRRNNDIWEIMYKSVN